jgi:pimeloyl-ACP methyl ester carboxylesterase
VAPALARSLQQASRVVQQRTKEEADVDVILERGDVAKRCVVDAGGRTSVVHQFAYVAATLPHAREPGFRERPQIIALRAQPGIDRGVAFHRRREAKYVFHRPSSPRRVYPQQDPVSCGPGSPKGETQTPNIRATISPLGIRKYFAQDLNEREKTVLVATQGPTSLLALTGTITAAAWKIKPSWYVVAKHDRMIDPELERFFAARMNATTIELAGSHVVMLSRPFEVAAFIRSAAAGHGEDQ